jgi:3,4-dihydroxy 2-butanone 4-phosphate synthase/GTP cyclohydrolase II
MSQSTIERVRRLVNEGGMTKSGLARAAGLHANTLRDVGEEDWNPTAETLGKLERFLSDNDETPVLVSIEEIIEEARNGRMYILVDDEDRENEGDVIIPAQMCTPSAINFMVTHCRGLVCLALSSERVDELALEPMHRRNRTPLGTAFTVSIEAKDGITTGISAADRARTVSVAIDGSKGADDIVSPGHVFPCAHVPAAFWSAPGTPRRRWTSRALPASTLGRDLRDHARGRHHGASGRLHRLCPPARDQDRHHPRPDRLSPQA